MQIEPSDFSESSLLKMLAECTPIHVKFEWTEDELTPIEKGKVYRIGDHYWRYTGTGWQMLDDAGLN